MKAKILRSESPLVGKIVVNGSKNSALPILAASLLTSDQIQLVNIPNIVDIVYMNKLLESLGASVSFQLNSSYSNHSLTVSCGNITSIHPCRRISNKLRASFVLLGPLLARFGKATIGFPGGCNIGQRSVDLHLDALEKMGAKIVVHEDGHIEASVSSSNGKLCGSVIKFSKSSVGATENILMAATLAHGITIIKNASVEPEVVDLTKFLIKLGAKIKGIGTRKLTIQGVEKLHGCSNYKIIPDRIEATTYATYAIATAGKLELIGIQKKHLSSIILAKLVGVGGKIVFKRNPNSMIVSRKADNEIRPITIRTNPYPKFPTDLQPQFCALLCLASSSSHIIPTSIIQENVFENRFQHVHELRKLGADIEFLSRQQIISQAEEDYNENRAAVQVTKLCSESNTVMIYGCVNGLKGNIVKATDLRCAASLVLAGLVASGETVIEDVDHLFRGYERMDVKLNHCGANIIIY